jgi:DNA-directed RNA polymerase specialized sigma24 family protein
MLRKSALLLCTAAILAYPLAASADDDKAMAGESRRIDRAAAGANGTDVATRIAADFPGTFGTPAETREIIADLRGGDLQGKDKGALGYGEIYISLALAQELASASGMQPEDALNEVLSRRIEGRGWGEIAKDFDLKLGQVVSRARSGNERLAAAFTRPEKADRAERPAKPERPMRPERPERPERGGRN